MTRGARLFQTIQWQLSDGVTEHKGLVYVANAGQTPDEFPGTVPSITGFRLDDDGKLHQIRGSRRVVGTANASAANTLFSPNGKVLVLTELNGNMVECIPGWRRWPHPG